ncbi:MAG: VanZ family protein [Candidatus Cloacimonadota bacterium]|nr:VanZ family protein [Candidatus Cloacimonadota bacterium]
MKIYKYLFYIWLAAIFVVTSFPTSALPSDKIMGIDKLGHFGVYLILAFLMLKKDNSILRRKHYLLALIIPVIDEVHQIFIPGRYFDLFDLIADFLGFTVIFLLLRFSNSF